MKAYKIAMAVALFHFSIPIAAELGFTGFLAAENINNSWDLVASGLSSWHVWVENAGILTLGTAMSRFAGMRMNVGSVAYLGLFTVGKLPLDGFLQALVEAGYLMPELRLLIDGMIVAVFIFGFIQLAGQPGRSMY